MPYTAFSQLRYLAFLVGMHRRFGRSVGSAENQLFSLRFGLVRPKQWSKPLNRQHTFFKLLIRIELKICETILALGLIELTCVATHSAIVNVQGKISEL